MPTYELVDCFALTLDDAAKVRETPDGYLVATPRVARTGIQLYRGSEVGDSRPVVRIFRPESEVFDEASMRSFAHKPVTDDHPPEPVTAKNWKKYSRGQIGDEVARDGEFVRVPMVLMDADTIRKAQSGKADLSVGYSCDIDMTPGTTADGQDYDGSQKNIRVNHVARVDHGRAGPMARIGDGSGKVRLNVKGYAAAMASAVAGKVSDADKANGGHLGLDGWYPVVTTDGNISLAATRAVITDSISNGDGDVTAAARSLVELLDTNQPEAKPLTKETKMAKHVVDGITVEMEDTAIQVVDKTIRGLNDQIAALKATASTVATDHAKSLADKDDQIAKLTTDLTTATTKVTTLEAQLKDAAVTPEKLEALVRDRSVMAVKAKALLPTVTMDGKTDAEIRKQVVDAKLGDAAKGWTDDQIATSFATLAADVKVDLSKLGSNVADVAASFSSPSQRSGSDVYDKRDDLLTNAWKTPTKVA